MLICQVNITIGASQKAHKSKKRGKIPGAGTKKEFYHKQRGSVLKDGETVGGLEGSTSWAR